MLAAYTPAALPASAAEHALDGGTAYLSPVDFDDACVNVDNAWFAEPGIEPPSTLSDLTEATYADMSVTPGAGPCASVGGAGMDGSRWATMD